MIGTLLLLVSSAQAADGGGGAPAPVLFGGVLLAVGAVAAVMFWDTVNGMIAAAAVGALAAVYLTVEHFIASHGGSSICNVSSVINCDTVNTSKYAELYGIGISIYGLGFYAAMGYLAFRRRTGRSSHAAVLLLIGALGAVGYDVFLAWKSATEIHAFCVFCGGTWLLNVLLLVGAGKLVRELDTSFVDALGKAFAEDAGPALVMGLVVFIVGVMIVRAQAPGVVTPGMGGGGGDDLSGLVERVRGKIVTSGAEPVRGDPSAKFMIVEFADYQCPHCGAMAPVLKKLLEENHDIKLLFKNYPLSSECNAHMDRPMHPWACNAAASAVCARMQGRFWELSEAMFGNQEYLSPDDIRFMAERAGIDAKAFSECLASPAALEAVKADVEAGAAAQIDGTPSIFVYGAYGDQWVKLLVGPGDKDRMTAFFAAARAGKPLPSPAEPAPLPE